jgi:hypothetical protein
VETASNGTQALKHLHFTYRSPKMRHLDMADEDWDMAMEALFDTLRKLPPEHKAQAYDVVERCLFNGQSDA